MKILIKDIVLGTLSTFFCIFISFLTILCIYDQLSFFGEFKSIVAFFSFFILYVSCTIILLFTIRYFFKFNDQIIELNDSVYSTIWKLCGYLYIFNLGIMINAGLVPVNMRSSIFKMLGSKIGNSVMIGGKILEPTMIEIGDYTILGEDSLLTGHAVEGDFVELGKIVVGNNVTVGVKSVILPNVHIGDYAIIAAGAVVTKGSRIGVGEIWGGIPAKKIGNISATS